MEKEMATHSSVLAWRIPGMGEPGGLTSMGSHRVGHDWNDLAAAVAAVPNRAGQKHPETEVQEVETYRKPDGLNDQGSSKWTDNSWGCISNKYMENCIRLKLCEPFLAIPVAGPARHSPEFVSSLQNEDYHSAYQPGEVILKNKWENTQKGKKKRACLKPALLVSTIVGV